MTDNSPTNDGNGNNSGADDSALPDNQNLDLAEGLDDADSGGDSRDDGRDEDNGRQDDTTQDDDSHDSSDADDDGLKRFAKAQGFDPDNLTDGERRALKLAHDNQKAFRNKQDATKLRDATTDVTQSDEDLDGLDDDEAERIRDRNERAEDRAERRTTRFYLQNPEAMDYDKEMGEIVAEERDTNGKEAARYLAGDLNRLLVLAKARRGDSDRKAEIEAARREERELLRNRQEAGSNGNAASSNTNRTPKVTDKWLDEEYDPSNADHRKMVDDAIARGDLY